MEPEWISWGPDSPGYPKCPVEPGTDCEVRFRDGDECRDTTPQGWEWDHIDNPYHDIIAYRVWPAKDDARALLVAIRACRSDGGVAETVHGTIEHGPGWSISGLTALLPRIDAYLERNR